MEGREGGREKSESVKWRSELPHFVVSIHLIFKDKETKIQTDYVISQRSQTK